MADTVLALLPVWGYVLLALFNSVGRCGVPAPSSATMIALGALVVDSPSELIFAISIGYGAALLGDIFAYPLGKRAGDWLEARSSANPKVSALFRRAEALAARWGSLAVLISRWPLSTVGPYVNLVAGALELSWPKYALSCLVGELVWVALYISLGYAFAANLDTVIALAGQASLWVLGVAVLAVGAVLWRNRAALLPKGK